MSPGIAGLLAVIAALAAMFLGVNVAVAMAVVGLAGVSLFLSPSVALHSLAPVIFARIGSYDLSVLPLFILMGQLMFTAGSGEKLYVVAHKWLGHLPGGLAVATVAACAGFAAISGSAIATAATIGSIALPEMLKRQYPVALAGGTVAAGGTLGILIPPSVTFIIYGIIVNESISALFIAGIVPGVLLAIIFSVVIVSLETLRLGWRRDAVPAPWRERWSSLYLLADTAVLFIVSIGGMFAGIFTPNEAGAVGAAGAFVIGLINGRINLKSLSQALAETVQTSTVVIFIIAGSALLSTFLTVTRLPFTMADWLLGTGLPAAIILLMIYFMYIIAGMVMEILPVIIITVPIFAPVVTKLGYDLVWFGAIIVLLGMMGMITPPVGINVYVVKKMLPQATLHELFRGVWPFVFSMLFLLICLTLWPRLVTYLPGLVG